MTLTLAWVESEIEKCLAGRNDPRNVTDFAILCIARNELIAKSKQDEKPIAENADVRPPIIMANPASRHETGYDTPPTVDRIGAALEVVARSAYDPAEKKKVSDLRTWREIIGENRRRS